MINKFFVKSTARTEWHNTPRLAQFKHWNFQGEM